jgi:MFS family permease
MPPKYQGTGFGIFSTAYTVIYSFGPYLTGLLSVRLGLERAMQISLTGAFVAIVIILFSRHFDLRLK